MNWLYSGGGQSARFSGWSMEIDQELVVGGKKFHHVDFITFIYFTLIEEWIRLVSVFV